MEPRNSDTDRAAGDRPAEVYAHQAEPPSNTTPGSLMARLAIISTVVLAALGFDWCATPVCLYFAGRMFLAAGRA